MHQLKSQQRHIGIKLCYLKLFIFLISMLLISISIILIKSNYSMISCLLSLVLGILYGNATGLQHELTHGIFPSKSLNYWFGVILGTVLTNSFTEYQLDHMKHHLFLGTPKNNEIFVRRDVKSLSLLTLVNNICMLGHHKKTIRNMLLAWNSNGIKIGNSRQMKRINNEYRAMSLFILILTALALFGYFWLVFYLFLFPVFFIALPIKSMVEIAEHFGCETSSTDIYKNSRVIPGRFAHWLTNGNNYHVIHHLHPNYPLSLTRGLYYELDKKVQHIEKSYIYFYLRLIVSLTKLGRKNGK